jgi:hypothetical protein
MTTMPDVITAPQAERHNRRRKGYPLPGSYSDNKPRARSASKIGTLGPCPRRIVQRRRPGHSV